MNNINIINFEQRILDEVRCIPDEALPEVLHLIESLKKSILSVYSKSKVQPQGSGICGIWVDERPPEDIISEIYSYRTNSNMAKIEL
ncbi:MAG: hypothetical protein HQK77_13110 [Desulfobacterales bacterium]|nr:hypothetical protein [Desulfobacterales bacterium]